MVVALAPRFRRRRRSLLRCWAALVAATVALLRCAAEAAGEAADDAAAAESERLRPRYERVAGDIETVWQLPPGQARGVFFIAHGCQHQGTDIFSDVGPDGWTFKACRSSNLGRCLGLPEEVRMRQAARSRGYVAMAVSGGSGIKSCWDMGRDAARVQSAIRHVKGAAGLPESAPVLATGASSGGAFVGLLAAPLEQGGLEHLRCILPQIMDVRGAPNRGVPALFVHMPRDTRTDARVQADLAALRTQGVRVGEIRVDPVPVTAALLAPCLPAALAEEAVQALREDGHLDDSGFLKQDARRRAWVPSLAKVLVGQRPRRDSLLPDESCLAEILNVAWAKHEFVARYAEEMLDFCEEGYADAAVGRGEL
eukprot:TRINITY_DN29111_c0_g1_i1.p1 TRINITY_DN29111_c0_g1~~TRINITY_DN29111_c0_g1_i1.p1  ORF type:complete len:401 (+),score=81.66 TRINITY_DN29111_c0_g1_i1:101-1204(+)